MHHLARAVLVLALATPPACVLAEVRPDEIEAPEEILIGIAPDARRLQMEFSSGALAWSAEDTPYILTASTVAAWTEGDRIRLRFDTLTLGPASRSWVIHPAAADTCRVNGRAYRGEIRISSRFDSASRSGVMTVVNALDIEEYLRGVVGREMGFVRPDNFEALKCQAVASRTYAVRNLGRRGALGFDLFATTADQVYYGADGEDTLSDLAILETRGEILTHDGSPIDAVYHSTCGGFTTTYADAWGGPDRPYLRVLEDRLGESIACAFSKYFEWTEDYSPESRVAIWGGKDTPVFTIFERDSSNRVRRLFVVRADTYAVVTGDRVRRALPRPDSTPLRSAMFEILPDSERLRVRGRGWGHGIGMCQVGAVGRARAGENHRAILGFYYPGTTLVRMRGPSGDYGKNAGESGAEPAKMRTMNVAPNSSAF